MRTLLTHAVTSTSVSAELEPDPMAPGDAARLLVTLALPPGCHVQSHAPREPFLIPTTVEIDAADGVTVGEFEYPAGDEVRFDWTPIVLDVYRDRVTFVAPVALSGDATLAPPALRGRIRYQACTENACLPPAENAFEARLGVLTEGA